MNRRILVVGSGGREHTLAWKLAQSPHVAHVFVAPGNGGTDSPSGLPISSVPIPASDIPGLVRFAQEQAMDLTVVGPEAPLVDGLVDALQAAGRRAFGPTAAAAMLEGSKAFAKRFMEENGIPTARGAIFTSPEEARAYLHRVGAPIVVKASGLAAGKGVIVCQTLEEAEDAFQRIMVDRIFGSAGDQVVIEEYLTGQEASLLCFTDGRTVVPMVPAQDHKAVYDGDRGPNTGGMGCYAPAPVMPPALVQEVTETILRPAVEGMRRRGTPYIGVLYAGLMLTAHGPRVLEFNCRFGDPEAQVILPLLETDLLEILEACLDGRLEQVEVRWREGFAACIVMASGGYPDHYEKGKEIHGLEEAASDPAVMLFHAGTRCVDGRYLTDGGRVLAVTATASTLPGALYRAYRAVERIHFEGCHYRRDIGRGFGIHELRRMETQPPPRPRRLSYRDAGVDINAGNRAVAMMTEAVQSTHTPSVLRSIGAFGGLFAADILQEARDPVLVVSTDGVGTKTLIAAAMGRYDTIGHDLVNHCINDILVQGARPLFFVDYIAAGRLEPEMVAAVVRSCAEACRAARCALIGGETAEMPDVYASGAFDLAGTIVGWVERDRIVDGRDVRPGDLCLGLPSSGLHTNGYSLARRAFADVPWDTVFPELGQPLGEALLTPHRSYLPVVEKLWEAGISVKAMAHITGGGFVDNIPRVLPPNVVVRLRRDAWEVPPIFRLIQRWGGVDEEEMYRVFNMGIGMVLILSPDEAARARSVLGPEEMLPIGEVCAGDSATPRVVWE
jgi:phosphoribosylamine--glycine ligase/phosphoribosylaminoimidazole synthetase